MKRSGYLVAIALLVFGGCASQRKLESLKKDETVHARIELPASIPTEDFHFKNPPRDTLTVHDFDGHEVMIMKAVRDEDGEMVATDVLDAAYITARFRNIAERHGKVDLHFDVIVPSSMQDSKWQTRFRPHLLVLGEKSDLDPVLITGDRYRKAQLKGYQQYERFLQRIVTDTTRFIDIRALEIFIKRNIPELYALKRDSTIVDDERFSSIYGVDEAQAISHYTDNLARKRNDWRKSRRQKMFSKYVKAPIRTTGLKLDTVITDSEGKMIIYEYVQTIATRPGLRNAKIWMDGEIYEQDRKLFSIPASDTLTFYISSISFFADRTDRYLDKIIERKVCETDRYRIEYQSGQSVIDESLSGNAEQIRKIKLNLGRLLTSQEYDLDSIRVTSTCSPEGSYSFNDRLSRKRSQQACSFFSSYIESLLDSLDADKGIIYDENGEKVRVKRRSIPLRARNISEDWDALSILVKEDSSLTEAQKSRFQALCVNPDPDRRERDFREESFYPSVRKRIYPMLRTVQIESFMSRKGMMKDTVHTSVLDTAYMRGIKAIDDRDYATAISILRPYQDYNLAVAYCAMDYNASAMAILRKMPRSDKVDYLMALLYMRQGDETNAVQKYLDAVNQNRSFIHRGNLDPEISALIKKYEINFETDNF